MDNKVAIVPLGEESGEVNRVLANETARRILDLISDEPLSTMRIAYKLNLAINTAQYNLEKLEAVGLVEVVRVEKSKKGRDMKIYAPTNKIIAIVPRSVNPSGIYDALKGIMPLLVIGLVLAVGIELFAYSPGVSTSQVSRAPIPAMDAADLVTFFPNESDNAAKSGAVLSEAIGAAPVENETRDVDQNFTEDEADLEMTASTSGELVEPTAVEEMEPAPIEIVVLQVSEPDSISKHPGIWVFVGALGVILAVFIIRSRSRLPS